MLATAASLAINTTRAVERENFMAVFSQVKWKIQRVTKVISIIWRRSKEEKRRGGGGGEGSVAGEGYRAGQKSLKVLGWSVEPRRLFTKPDVWPDVIGARDIQLPFQRISTR